MFNPNEIELIGEPESLGSDCCQSGVRELDGVIVCNQCNEPCEEVFETEEQLQDRLEDIEASRDSDIAESRWEAEREDRHG